MAQRNDQYSKLCKQRLIKSMVKPRVTQQLEDLPRHKKARTQFTIERPDVEAEDEAPDAKLLEKIDKKVKMSKVHRQQAVMLGSGSILTDGDP
ncbi:hypothetical protein P43SY_010925 [Pythium insidiosum]|uniref:Uncharacterized protein n=1 Tax=Pythium insidiosum TaxID=114742 RepID=A0AAD5LQG9_PYTIN|nr:hypothetical protein P43SY_010925 [Pythium insidiosum]